MKITIQTIILADKQKVWDYYTKPEHITKWNFANDDWCCPSAENDLQVGGKYKARMEAKDKSFGFDFEAIYNEIVEGDKFTYILEDGREVNVSFATIDDKTNVTIIFDSEKENSKEMQRNGWQSILNNFKSYVESTNRENNMKKLTYSITINKQVEFVFNKIMDKSVYPQWAKAWGEGMTYEGQWKQGGHISFFDKSQGGTKVIIEELKPSESIKTKHVAMVNPQNVEVELTDEMMRKWIGSREDYYFKKDGEAKTTLEVVMEIDQVFQEMFDKAWPKALEYFREVCEL